MVFYRSKKLNRSQASVLLISKASNTSETERKDGTQWWAKEQVKTQQKKGGWREKTT